MEDGSVIVTGAAKKVQAVGGGRDYEVEDVDEEESPRRSSRRHS